MRPTGLKTRRELLQVAGAAAVLAPFVPLLSERQAHAKARPPKRLLFFYNSNGTIHERWVPTVNDDGLVLSEILAPLERHRRDLLVVDGLGYHCTDKSKGGHEGGMNAALTGSVPKVIDVAKGKSRATSLSIDQLVANRQDGLKFRSLECGIQVDTYDAAVYALSYTGPLQPVMPENDPYRLYFRVFGNMQQPGSAADPFLLARQLERRSLIDLVKADLKNVSRQLGASEQQKMDGHLQAVREIERTLATGPGPASLRSCVKINPGSPPLNIHENDNILLLGKLHADILVAALSCDLTRVGTIQHGRAGANHRLSWLGPEFSEDPAFVAGKDETKGIHSLAHSESRPESRRRLTQCQAWYGSQVANLVDALGKVPEGQGTLADSTLVVWMNEMGTGNHKLTNTPWVLVGNCQKSVRTNQLLSAPRTPHNGLLLSIAHAMGCDDLRSFGAADYCRGPLQGFAA